VKEFAMKNNGSLKHRIGEFAHRLGYTVIPNWQMDTFRSAEFLRRFFDYLNIDCVIDVGANAGQYHKFLVEEVGFEGLVASFEPIPALAAKLQGEASGNPKWLVDGCALGREPGSMTFNVMANTEFSSFLAPLSDKTAAFGGANTVTQTVSVEVKTLDQVVPKLRRERGVKNIYLKLDTQGFDLEVLKGAAASLETISGLQSEMSVRPIYAGMPRYGEVIAYLEERGFVMSGLFPNNAGHFPLLIEFDCYMFRPDKGSDARRVM
jgi:FkbM family methyltransferase